MTFLFWLTIHALPLLALLTLLTCLASFCIPPLLLVYMGGHSHEFLWKIHILALCILLAFCTWWAFCVWKALTKGTFVCSFLDIFLFAHFYFVVLCLYIFILWHMHTHFAFCVLFIFALRLGCHPHISVVSSPPLLLLSPPSLLSYSSFLSLPYSLPFPPREGDCSLPPPYYYAIPFLSLYGGWGREGQVGMGGRLGVDILCLTFVHFTLPILLLPFFPFSFFPSFFLFDTFLHFFSLLLSALPFLPHLQECLVVRHALNL